MFVKEYRQSEPGGNAPGIANERIDIPGPSGSNANPLDLNAGQLAALDRDLNGPSGDDGEEPSKPELGQFDEYGKPLDAPNEPPADELPVDEYTDEQLLAELELDNHSDVRSALLAYKQLMGDFTNKNQVVTRLEQTAKQLGTTPDALLEQLAQLDPRGQADSGPRWDNFERFVSSHVDPQHHDHYRSLAGALAEDLKAQVTGNFGRIIKSQDSALERLQEQMDIQQFTRAMTVDKDGAVRLKNPDWFGRETEIAEALRLNPVWKNNPNRIDLARRFVLAGKEPKSERQKINEAKKQAILESRAKAARRHVEGPGRTLPSNKTAGPVGEDGLTSAQRDAVLADADRKGLRLA